MDFVSFDEVGVKAWDEFCIKSDNAWFRHTSTWIDYSLNMRFEKKGTQNLTFGIKENNKLIAIVPLIKEKIYSDPETFEFGFAGINNPFPALSVCMNTKKNKNILSEIFSEIYRLAKKSKVDYAAFEISPLIPLVRQGYYFVNPLPKFGFNDTQIATHIVDLRKSENDLFASCRKGHKSDIAFALKKNPLVKVLDSQSITEKDFQRYKNIHFQAAGRQTRPEKTWNLMHEWIKKDLAVLSLYFTNENVCIAAALSIVYKAGSYYGSSCILPQYNSERGIMHLLLWETIKFLKKREVCWYETGLQYMPTLSQEVPSEKEINISLFKRGFGGVNVPYYRGEKFYSRDYFLKVQAERIHKYARFF